MQKSEGYDVKRKLCHHDDFGRTCLDALNKVNILGYCLLFGILIILCYKIFVIEFFYQTPVHINHYGNVLIAINHNKL